MSATVNPGKYWRRADNRHASVPRLTDDSQLAANQSGYGHEARRHLHLRRAGEPAGLEAIISDRNSTSKAVWRARIVLATADGHGTNAIMRLTGKSKPCVWRWQERYIAEGIDGLLRDKTRPSGKKPLSRKVRLKVLAKTANETPANATHWSRASMAAQMGISPSSVGRIWAEPA